MSARALVLGPGPPTVRSLRANAGLALAGDAAAKAGALATLAVAARLLPAREFAVFGTTLAAVTILTALLDGGAATVIVRDGARSSARAGGLVAATALARLPLAVLVVAVAAAGGVATGHAAEWVLAALISITGAATLTVLAMFRAGQDLAFEARQRLLAAALAPLAVGVLLAARATPSAALAGLLAAFAAALVPFALRARSAISGAARPPALAPLAAGLPFVLIALATLAYYRSGTFFLAAWQPPLETGTFVVASSIGFGLLALPNAITTGLLPRLAGDADAERRAETARAALAWAVRAGVPVAAAVALLGGPAVAVCFGDRYRAAGTPLAILAVGLVLVAAAGVLGTVLIAERRTTLLAVQVFASLAVNLIAAAVLVRHFGADGAAWATVATEAVALAVLAPAAAHSLPGLVRSRPQLLAFLAVAGLLAAAAAADGAARAVLVLAALGTGAASDPVARALLGGRS